MFYVVVFLAGVFVGGLVMALLSVSGRTDDMETVERLRAYARTLEEQYGLHD